MPKFTLHRERENKTFGGAGERTIPSSAGIFTTTPQPYLSFESKLSSIIPPLSFTRPDGFWWNLFVAGITEGPDSTSNSNDSGTSLRAAGTLRTGSLNPQGHKISLGAMLRLEVEPASGTFRISVRAVHVTVAVCIRRFLISQLDGSSGGGGAVGEVVGAGGVGA